MKKQKELTELAEIKAEIARIDSRLVEVNGLITDHLNKGKSLLPLIKEERELRSFHQKLTIKAHQMENKLIDLGRGPAFGLYRLPQVKSNQYSS
jgi:hypothetical protein